MIEVLFTGPTSACFELKNRNPYYAPHPFTAYLNGKKIPVGETNVFSVYDLTPDTAYEMTVVFDETAEKVPFRTRGESCAVSVKDFGAVGDGMTNDTAAVRAAVACLPEGGRLIFPAGTYLTEPLFLKSRMTLELKEGAVLLGSPDREAYPVLPGTVTDPVTGEEVIFGVFEGVTGPMYQSLLTAQYAEDITIVGPGRIDGNAGNSDFWTAYKEFSTYRPRLLFANHCKHITLHGVQAANSPSWQLHPFFSDDVNFFDVAVSAPKNSPNTDAIDPESCDGVKIIGCRFDVGDDCIAIKSGKIELGRRYKKPAENHVIRNCLMQFGHGAVTLGSEAGAGVKDLTVTQCRFEGTDRGLRIKSRRGRGKDSVIDNITFDNLVMDGVLTPIVINMWYNCCDPDRFSEYVWSREKLPVDERTPHLGRFCFRNMDCRNAEVAACYIEGLPESPIDEVTFENVRISFSPDAKPGIPSMKNFAENTCRLGLHLDYVKKIRLKGVTLTGQDGEPLIADHFDSVETEEF